MQSRVKEVAPAASSSAATTPITTPILSHHTQIIHYIESTIQSWNKDADNDEKITRLKKIVAPIQNRTIVCLFENHLNSTLTNQLACILAEKLNIELIAVEHPILRTSEIEQGIYQGDVSGLDDDDSDYSQSLQALGELKPMVCIDDREALFTTPYFEQYAEALMESGLSEEATEDLIRDDIMTHTLCHFTSANRILTINGMAHCDNFIKKLTALAPTATIIPIILFVREQEIERPSIKIVKKRSYSYLEIQVSNDASLLHESSISAILTLLSSEKQEAKAASQPSASLHQHSFMTAIASHSPSSDTKTEGTRKKSLKDDDVSEDAEHQQKKVKTH